ncbi:MAG: ABC transporter permease, partial [Gaiellaceae bacterium]
GWPATRIGGPAGRLARQNSRRNPGRTAATAAALMIGLALVTFVASLGEGMRKSNTAAIEDQVAADFIVTSQNGFEPFQSAAGDAVEKTPGIELATSVRASLAKAAGSDKYVTGIDPDTILEAYSFDWAEGSDDVIGELGRRGAIVTDDFAKDKNLQLGSTFTVSTPENEELLVQVKGTYEPPPFYPLLGDVVLTKDAFDATFDRPRNQFTFVNFPGEPTLGEEQALESSLELFPDSDVRTRATFIADQEADIAMFLNLLYVLLALSVIVSLFGMVNTLVLSVFERTRELGMLRAVGMTRRQTRRMIRHESVITALIGAALGIPLGIFLAFLVTGALREFGLQFAVPVGSLVAFAVVAIVAGLLAAVLPARRAARLNVLNALQYE